MLAIELHAPAFSVGRVKDQGIGRDEDVLGDGLFEEHVIEEERFGEGAVHREADHLSWWGIASAVVVDGRQVTFEEAVAIMRDGGAAGVLYMTIT